MAKRNGAKLTPDGWLAELISELNDLETWEFREVIKSTIKLRRATKAITKAETKRARKAQIERERKKAIKGLSYERAD